MATSSKSAVVKVDAQTLQVYKRSHEKILKQIHSIPPASRDCVIEYKSVNGLKLSKLGDYAVYFGNLLSKNIGFAQDECITQLKECLQSAKDQSDWIVTGGHRVDQVFSINLKYTYGGVSSIGTAAFYFKKTSNTTCNVAHAFYGEKWKEQKHVKLIMGKWPDQTIQEFLTFRLIERLPTSMREITA